MLRNKKLLLALPILLLVALLVNLGSVAQVLRGERSLRSVVYGLAKPGPDDALYGWAVPPDTGDAKARVTVEVFLRGGDPCHANTAFVGQALGTLDPARLRVKFVDAASGQAAVERREKLKLGCEQGFAVNGKTEFRIPDPTTPGKKRTVFTAHQKGPSGPAVSLYAILDQELRAAYKGKGFGLTEAEFQQKVGDGVKQARDAALAAAKARQDKK